MKKANKLCAHKITRQARATSNNTILSMIILLPIILIKMNELADNELIITVSNFARNFLPHRLYDTTINNVMYAVKIPKKWRHQPACCDVSSSCSSSELSVSWSARCWVAAVTCSATVSRSCTSDRRWRVLYSSSLVLFSSFVVSFNCFCSSPTGPVASSDILVLKLISVLVFILFSSQNFYFI